MISVRENATISYEKADLIGLVFRRLLWPIKDYKTLSFLSMAI
jgi:hypothetical protein